MKNLLLKTILFLTPALTLVISVNYFGDAANLFTNNFEEEIAKELVKGNNVTNVYNYDERLLQKYLITGNSICPEIVVLGSSRSMLINSSFFSNRTFFNNSVSGATLEDLFAICQLYKEKDCVPKEIIIGLDPWMLNVNHNQIRWKSLATEYNRFLKDLTGSSEPTQRARLSDYKYYQLISPSYFQSSLKNLFLNKKTQVTSSKVNDTFTRLYDGSISYDLEYRSVSPDEVEMKAFNFANADIYSIEGFNELSDKYKKYLEFFVKYLKGLNIRITFFMAPYHPKVYEVIAKSDKYKQVEESELFFVELSKKYRVDVLGSLDPRKLGLNNTDFYDGMHCNELVIKKILADSVNQIKK